MINFNRTNTYGVSDKEYIELVDRIDSKQRATAIVRDKIVIDLSLLEARYSEVRLFYRNGGEQPSYLLPENQHLSMYLVEELLGTIEALIHKKRVQLDRYNRYLTISN